MPGSRLDWYADVLPALWELYFLRLRPRARDARWNPRTSPAGDASRSAIGRWHAPVAPRAASRRPKLVRRLQAAPGGAPPFRAWLAGLLGARRNRSMPHEPDAAP